MKDKFARARSGLLPVYTWGLSSVPWVIATAMYPFQKNKLDGLYAVNISLGFLIIFSTIYIVSSVQEKRAERP